MRLPPIACLIALPLLTACAPTMTTSLPVSAIITAGEGTASLTIPATLRVPYQDNSACVDAIDRLVKRLQTVTPITGRLCTSNSSSQDYAELETVLTLVRSELEPSEKTLLQMTVTADTNPAQYNIHFHMTHTMPDLIALVTGDSGRTDEPLPRDMIPEFTFFLRNDLTQAVQVDASDIFVDDRPVVSNMDSPITIAPGASPEIVLSDFASAIVAQNGFYEMMTIYPAER